MTTSLVALSYQDNWWQILTSAFMRNALVGGTIVALAAGLIGYFVVVRNTAFAAHALAHIGLPGATGAALLGLPGGTGTRGVLHRWCTRHRRAGAAGGRP